MQKPSLNKGSLPITLGLLNKLPSPKHFVLYCAWVKSSFLNATQQQVLFSFMTFHFNKPETQLTIRHSRTDRLGAGTILRRLVSNGVACPVAAMHNYLLIFTAEAGL